MIRKWDTTTRKMQLKTLQNIKSYDKMSYHEILERHCLKRYIYMYVYVITKRLAHVCKEYKDATLTSFEEAVNLCIKNIIGKKSKSPLISQAYYRQNVYIPNNLI